MSKLRRKKIDCGPFGSLTLMIGDQEKAVAYLSDRWPGDYENVSVPKGGFVNDNDNDGVHLWLNTECDLNSLIAHESFHAACSLLHIQGIHSDLRCDACEETLAMLTGHIAGKVSEQIWSWQQ